MATLEFAGVVLGRAVDRYARELAAYRRQVNLIPWRTLTRARRDIGRLYARMLREEANKVTTRRTGNLTTGLKIQSSVNRGQRFITFRPSFPRTQYQTPRGRGDPGASKSGQYAFVLNHRFGFIEAANRRIVRSPELQAILDKHRDFIVRDINSKKRTIRG